MGMAEDRGAFKTFPEQSCPISRYSACRLRATGRVPPRKKLPQERSPPIAHRHIEAARRYLYCEFSTPL
jgi:hypothetical protein